MFTADTLINVLEIVRVILVIILGILLTYLFIGSLDSMTKL